MRKREAFLCIVVGTAALGAPATLLAEDSLGFETGVATVHILPGGGALWDYLPKGLERRHGMGAPRISLDGQDVTLALATAKALGPPVVLANGCREYSYAGEVQGMEGLRLKLLFRAADGDPVVRFRYEVQSDRDRHLTKPEGTDRLNYLDLSLSALPEVSELRLSEFNDEVHSYMPVERPLEARHFADRWEAMGPILLAGDSKEQLLLAYEHGSTAADEFLHFRLAPDRSVTLEAVKGNYWAGEEVGPDTAYVSVWFEMAAVPGDRLALQKAYRTFVLHHLALSPATRKPRVFYNTWNYQERLKHWKGKPYLSEMNTDRMLQEIEVAHQMGVDVFVIDTGWYEKTGDWQPSPTRFPDGLRRIQAKLMGYGMKLGLWFDPNAAAVTSLLLETHNDCIETEDGKARPPGEIWETEASQTCCLVSRFGDDVAAKLVDLSRQLGVTYFKFDGMAQYGCNDPGHGHGTAANSLQEREDCHAFQMPLAMARLAETIGASVPDAICDFDVTESGRSFGLAYLSAGKYFLINNGPYFQNYDHPLPPDGNWNLFFYPGPARDWICRSPLVFDRWIPSTLFLTHYLPDDPENNQRLSLASLILGQGGIWGDLPAVSNQGVALFGTVIGKFKQVQDDMTEAYPVESGSVGGTPEVHEKIAANGKGAVVIFSRRGSYRYVTESCPNRKVWHDAGSSVTFDDSGRAVIVADFPSERGGFPKAGAHIIFFGVD
jgi:alpha-galactosidase